MASTGGSDSDVIAAAEVAAPPIRNHAGSFSPAPRIVGRTIGERPGMWKACADALARDSSAAPTCSLFAGPIWLFSFSDSF